METRNRKKRLAILGAGPSGLFMFKRLVDAANNNIEISVFEKNNNLGMGMPYSSYGANDEHITNVSDNEIPQIVCSIEEWIQTVPASTLKRFDINAANFNEYKVLPRLLFGQYLSAQFTMLIKQAKNADIQTTLYLNTTVIDIIDEPERNKVLVITDNHVTQQFDFVIICTGHNWPAKHEGIIPQYYDSPYPPAKLQQKINYPVAIKGASLTAIDAVRTLARQNGSFEKDKDDLLFFKPHKESEGFKLVMHSRNGLLPGVRFHLEDSHLSKDAVLSKEELQNNMALNNGFVSLDFLFDMNFKQPLKEQNPDFYEKIKDMKMEIFVDEMMNMRESIDPFQLLKGEYAEAEKSIKRKQSVYWKEMLAVLSFAMNYPAKHLSAEDMIRLQKVLMPLISLVIAFVPQSSCKEMLALHNAGLLSLIPVGEKSNVEPQQQGGAIYHYNDEESNKESVHYKMFVDCVGQPHLSINDFPFKSLLQSGVISAARIKFRSDEEGHIILKNGNTEVETDADGSYYLKVPGITIDDSFRLIDKYGAVNDHIYIMAVPYIGGYNPDYSGLDFSEAASERIIKSINANKEIIFID